MKRWLANHARDIGAGIVIAIFATVLALGIRELWGLYQAQRASEENVRIIERAVGAFHENVCQDPQGPPPDRSCE